MDVVCDDGAHRSSGKVKRFRNCISAYMIFNSCIISPPWIVFVIWWLHISTLTQLQFLLNKTYNKKTSFYLYVHLILLKENFIWIDYFFLTIMTWNIYHWNFIKKIFPTMDNNFAQLGINTPVCISIRVFDSNQSFIVERNVTPRCDTCWCEVQGW